MDSDDAITFAAADGPVTVKLKRVQRAGDGLDAVVETDVRTAARGLFHDTPENRLEDVEGGLDADLPVLIELALRDADATPPPGPGHDLVRWLETSGLLREDAWNARVIWQEHQVGPALGGGVLKIGYRTVFSAPRNEIDRLKRRGRVTRTVVEALIENGLPVHFEADAFELELSVGGRDYACRLRPDDEAMSMHLTVLEHGVPRGQDVIDDANRELAAGELARDDDGLRYTLELRFDAALLSEAFVIETLRAGVSVTHQHASSLLE